LKVKKKSREERTMKCRAQNRIEERKEIRDGRRKVMGRDLDNRREEKKTKNEK